MIFIFSSHHLSFALKLIKRKKVLIEIPDISSPLHSIWIIQMREGHVAWKEFTQGALYRMFSIILSQTMQKGFTREHY